MSPEFMKKVFEPFEQERNAYSNAVQGTGLGLTLARQTVRAMGGDITVESTLGEGSVFTIKFPCTYRVQKEKIKTEQSEEIEEELLSGKHILLCDDNHINVVISQKILEKEGCIVDCAENGKVAFDKFEASSDEYYDAIIMDIRMPVMDGLTATRQIRMSKHPQAQIIPIIAVSANAFEEDIQKSIEAGMSAHLSKPVDPSVLYREITKQIKKRYLKNR